MLVEYEWDERNEVGYLRYADGSRHSLYQPYQPRMTLAEYLAYESFWVRTQRK